MKCATRRASGWVRCLSTLRLGPAGPSAKDWARRWHAAPARARRVTVPLGPQPELSWGSEPRRQLRSVAVPLCSPGSRR